jgi:dipeptidyl aminopeptidase/acylaminoacyl peptidase
MNRRLLLLFLAFSIVLPLAAETPRGSLTIDRIAAIKTPSDAAWAPDGKTIAFLWDDAGVRNLFAVRPGQQPVALTNFPGSRDTMQIDVGPFVWTDSENIVFAFDGKLWKVSLSSKPVAIPGIERAGEMALSADRKTLAYIGNGQLFVTSLQDIQPRQVTRLTGGQSASAPVFSPDGSHIAFLTSKVEQRPEIYPYNGSRVGFYQTYTSGRNVGIIAAKIGSEPTLLPVDGTPNYVQWVNNDSILFQRVSPDMKVRELKIMTLAGKMRDLWVDKVTDRWWQPIQRDARTEVSPDGKWVAFHAARSGWTHLYVMPTNATSEQSARQLTSGEFETGMGGWSADSKRVAYFHSKGNLMERYLAIADIETGKTETIVDVQGVSYWPRFSPDGSAVVYEHTDVRNALDIYVASTSKKNSITRLSDSLPAEIQRADLTPPVPVSFPSRVDGKPVPATIMVHKNIDRSRKNPAIVWIHGSGADQNFLGWHPGSYRMYYSMHQYLAQQGYIILTPDYRGSSGYGADWGTGHYMDLGGKDYLDVASGADYLKTLDYVDPDRIGVWGLSYGGFLTLQAVTITPTLFRCAIDVAGVSDWAKQGQTSGGGWTIGRLGWPSENADVYHRTASINFMDKLERPLLILHATADTNVPIRHTFDLVDELVKLQKDYELDIYPGDIHFFRKNHVLRAAWKRSEEFFDRQLKSGNPMRSQ